MKQMHTSSRSRGSRISRFDTGHPKDVDTGSLRGSIVNLVAGLRADTLAFEVVTGFWVLLDVTIFASTKAVPLGPSHAKPLFLHRWHTGHDSSQVMLAHGRPTSRITLTAFYPAFAAR
jgi:hypothetical protein